MDTSKSSSSPIEQVLNRSSSIPYASPNSEKPPIEFYILAKIANLYEPKYTEEISSNGISIDEEEVKYWFDKHIQVIHMKIYITYLNDFIISPRNLGNAFHILLPPDDNSSNNQSSLIDCIDSTLEKIEEQNKLFLVPRNLIADHWVLLAINPSTMIVYSLDPMHDDQTKQSMMKIKKAIKKKKPVVKWIPIECPKQTNNIDIDNEDFVSSSVNKSVEKPTPIERPQQTNNSDSGYFVLSFMRDIIFNKTLEIPEQYYDDDSGKPKDIEKVIEEVQKECSQMMSLLILRQSC